MATTISCSQCNAVLPGGIGGFCPSCGHSEMTVTHLLVSSSVPHRFQALGPDCICGRGRYESIHFNGDVNLALLAQKQEREREIAHRDWIDHLKVGSRVQINKLHPRDWLIGRTGVIARITRDRRGDVSVLVNFTGPVRQFEEVPAQFLQNPDVIAEVPKFNSVEEADKWLRDRAKEMGIPDESQRRIPHFDTPEEADEWMRKQVPTAKRDPYVPAAWSTSTLLATGGIISNGDTTITVTVSMDGTWNATSQ